MKRTYFWGALAGFFIFLETLAGIKLGIFASPDAKTLLLFINLLTLGIGIYWALRDYKQRNDGLISFGRCMFNGIIISAMAGVITATGAFITYHYIVKDQVEANIVENEKYLVHKKDSTANTVAEYKQHFIKNYRDTVRTTQKDLPAIEKMATDSANVLQEKVDRSKSFYSFTGQMVINIGPFVLVGLILSLIVAAVIANKKS